MMYEFMDAWINVCYSNGLQKSPVAETNSVVIGPDFKGSLPDIRDGVVVHATCNQSWLIVRTQFEGLHDLDNVHAVQDLYTLTPLSIYGKNYVSLDRVVNPNILTTPGPSPQANALNGQQFFTKFAEQFDKVPFPVADRATGIEKVLEQMGIKYGQPYDYASLPLEQKRAMDAAVAGVQAECARITANLASVGGLKNGWIIPEQQRQIYRKRLDEPEGRQRWLGDDLYATDESRSGPRG